MVDRIKPEYLNRDAWDSKHMQDPKRKAHPRFPRYPSRSEHGLSSDDAGQNSHTCTERASFGRLFNGMGDVNDRLDRVERTQEIIVTGQGAINEQLIAQRISMGKIETSLDFIVRDVHKQREDLEEVESKARGAELEKVKRDARKGVWKSVLGSVWSAKQYWFIPIVAALTGYLSIKIGL